MTTPPWAWPGIWAAVLCCSAGAPQAQPSLHPMHPATLGLEAAWARQPEQQAAALRRDAIEAARRSAQRWTPAAPTLELSHRSDRTVRNDGQRELEATLAAPLWLPGERSRSHALADADATLLEARLAAARLKLAEQVRSSLWDQARAAQELQLADARTSHARRLADDVARRLEAGDLAQADAHQAQAALAAVQAGAAEARAAATRTARRWHALTGLPPLAQEPPPEARPHDAEAASSHPELRLLAARAASAVRQRELAASQQWPRPEVAIGTVRERSSPGQRFDQSIVVGVRVPLGGASDSAMRIATAAAEQTEAESALAIETRRIEGELAAAKDLVVALDLAAAAAQRRATLAIESRGFFDKAFRLGQTDLPTRLRIELEAFEAERQAARSRIELSAAISALRQALGQLPE